MADENKEKAAGKKPAAAKKVEAVPADAVTPEALAARATPAKPGAASAPAKKPAKTGATVTVTRTGSDLGRQKWVLATFRGLGLGKTHRTRTLEDTPAVRGMINRVKHLVRVEEPSETNQSKTGT